MIACIDEPLPAELLNQGPFQFVLCTEVLEHVADWPMAFKNLASLMSSGGHLLITCPFFYPVSIEKFVRVSPAWRYVLSPACFPLCSFVYDF